jgi:hypothetical protein
MTRSEPAMTPPARIMVKVKVKTLMTTKMTMQERLMAMMTITMMMRRCSSDVYCWYTVG